MPLYDLVLQVKARVPKREVFELLKRTSLKILDANGVLMDVKSFGHQTLAYVYKKPNERHHEVQMSQMTFASAPNVLPEISHALRVDEKVVRWMVLKRKRKMEPLIKYKAWTEEQRAAMIESSRESESSRDRGLQRLCAVTRAFLLISFIAGVIDTAITDLSNGCRYPTTCG